ncbi:MAG: putative lipoprotein [Deltaproteobacteria bacterium]|nr:putative lipoprotein [Deltaproteobacteria bacterium]
MRAIPAASLVLLLVAGCSFYDSSRSSSESSGSSSASSASSSGSSASSAARKDSYINDVAGYTEAYAKSGGQFDGFTRGLSEIAQKHGVTDWESDADTFTGIGAGLRRANVPSAQFEVWKQNLTNGDATKATAMQKGYDNATPK